jgi:WhiB family redox-sensing transcriptional regulator
MLSQAPAATDWRAQSACLQVNPELFFPVGSTGPAVSQVDQAKLVCQRCEVQRVCLEWALEAKQDHGVWGGMTEDERRSLRRRTARQRATVGV